MPAAALASQRETERIELPLADGSLLPLLRVRDRRAKRLRLTVNERGARLSLPWRVAEAKVQDFLCQHLDWLARQWALRRAQGPACHGRYAELAQLPLWGEEHALAWRCGPRTRFGRMDDGGFALVVPPDASPAEHRRALRALYVAEAKAVLESLLRHYQPGLPRPPSGLRLRAMSSLWGSLSPRDVVSLDLALVLGPRPAFEYVLVHELCHLLRPDHSPAFWWEVEQRLPQWREQRAWLRSAEGLALKARWHGLFAAG